MSRYNEIYFDVRVDDNEFETIVIDKLDFTVPNLHFGYFENHDVLTYSGKIDEIRIFHSRITGNYDKYISYAHFYLKRCPFYCDGCDYLLGTYECTSCKGNRIKDKNICICPEGTFEDYSSLNCPDLSTKYKLFTYYNFDGENFTTD